LFRNGICPRNTRRRTMGRKVIDLTGKKFGRLTVIGRSPERSGGKVCWDCICECGGEKRVKGCSLKSGNTTSCGCRRTENVGRPVEHGISGSYQYSTWSNIKSRCYNESNHNYRGYGGRGIKLYYRWKDDPKAFCEWLDRFLGPRPEGHTLDRINNDGDYEPRNLRWADRKTQQNNRRTSK
jgi:hypothetical protein